MLYVIYSLVLICFTIYSYSQIDLNLTLSSNSLYQYFQNQLIYLGYFNRPLSAIIYLILLFLFSIFYFLFLYLVKQKKLSFGNVLFLIGITCGILFFSYSAFSHDLFNYMFDARIVTAYGQNPYVHSALDFPADLWTRFMHWTHRTYPYGPVWLLLTLPFSFLGFGKFVLTLFNFKLLFLSFHLGNIYMINKILNKTDPKSSMMGTAFYAFSPVVLVESLVSPHNEVVMLFFLLLAIYEIVIKKRYLLSIIFLLFSFGIKFITIILLPLFIFKHFTFYSSSDPERSEGKSRSFISNSSRPAYAGRQARTIYTMRWLKLIFFFLIPPLLYEIYLREPYSWYFIPLLGVGALLIKYESINILIAGISFGALLRYVPFLYMGEYGIPVQNMQNMIFYVVILLTVGLVLLSLRGSRFNRETKQSRI